MKTITQTLMGKTAEWEKTNPVLLEGMLGVEVRADGSRRIKIGDGQKNWKDPALKAVGVEDIESLEETKRQVDELLEKVNLHQLGMDLINQSLEATPPEGLLNISALFNNLSASVTSLSENLSSLAADVNTSVNHIETLSEGLTSLTDQMSYVDKRIVGEYVDLPYHMTDAELAANRLLKLEGQPIPVALYEELVEKIWVGPEANATALFRYRCDENGGRNPLGLFFTLEDWRGVFPRVYGVNSVLRTNMANSLSPPYDGKGIGDFIPDALPSAIKGHLRANGLYWALYNTSGVFNITEKTFIRAQYYSVSQDLDAGRLNFDIADVYRTSNQVEVASLSYVKCIRY